MRLSAACAFPGGHQLVCIWLLLVWSRTLSWTIWPPLPLKIAGLCIGSYSIDVKNAASLFLWKETFHVDVRKGGWSRAPVWTFFVLFWIYALLSLSNKHNDVDRGETCEVEWDVTLDPCWSQAQAATSCSQRLVVRGWWCQCKRDLLSQVLPSFAVFKKKKRQKKNTVGGVANHS